MAATFCAAGSPTLRRPRTLAPPAAAPACVAPSRPAPSLLSLRRSNAAPPLRAAGADPKIHEAIAREESHQFKAGIVSHEVRRGFLLRERLLRPATVKVSTGSGNQETSSPSSEKPVEDSKEDAAV